MKCLTPISVQTGIADFLAQVRCGHCLGCRVTRREAWTVRILAEQQLSESAIFLTLTYAEKHLPQSLCAEDMQKFFKRLRKNSGQTIRYFCCGEYGMLTGRPHWHMMIFNLLRPGQTIMKGPVFLKSWRLGYCYAGEVNSRTARYVAKYSLKDADNPGAVVLSSRDPAIGAAWFFQMGVALARQRQHQPIRSLPVAIMQGKNSYPIDRTAGEAMRRGWRYEALGEAPSSNPLVLDLLLRKNRLLRPELEWLPKAEAVYLKEQEAKQRGKPSPEKAKKAAARTKSRFAAPTYLEDGSTVPSDHYEFEGSTAPSST